MKRKKGFTLVELLVVISIIALLMGILMPALARVREVAYRLICGTNLSGIGKSMMVYANDHRERFPRAGGRRSVWSPTGRIEQWDAENVRIAFGSRSEDTPLLEAPATITSSFYLLVKYADVTTKQFICKGDTGSEVFKLSEHAANILSTGERADLTDVWDFGGENDEDFPVEHVSYSYHSPYYNDGVGASFPVSAIRNPQSPVAADKNPYLDRNIGIWTQQEGIPPEKVQEAGSGWYVRDTDQWLNIFSHQREGQNVLYADAHVNFEKRSTVGINKDNIWQCWEVRDIVPEEDKLYKAAFMMSCDGSEGYPPGDPALAPYDYEDAFLVNDCVME